MIIPQRAIYWLNTIPKNISMKYSLKNWKNILKFIWNHKKILDSQSNLEQKKNAGKITVADFKLYYRAMVIKQYGI